MKLTWMFLLRVQLRQHLDLHNDSDGVDHHSSPSHGGSSEKSGDQHNHCHCVDKLLDEPGEA